MIAANHDEFSVSLFKLYKEFDERESFHDTRDFPRLFSLFPLRGNRDAIAETCHDSAMRIFVDAEPAFCKENRSETLSSTRAILLM